MASPYASPRSRSTGHPGRGYSGLDEPPFTLGRALLEQPLDVGPANVDLAKPGNSTAGSIRMTASAAAQGHAHHPAGASRRAVPADRSRFPPAVCALPAGARAVATVPERPAGISWQQPDALHLGGRAEIAVTFAAFSAPLGALGIRRALTLARPFRESLSASAILLRRSWSAAVSSRLSPFSWTRTRSLRVVAVAPSAPMRGRLAGPPSRFARTSRMSRCFHHNLCASCNSSRVARCARTPEASRHHAEKRGWRLTVAPCAVGRQR